MKILIMCGGRGTRLGHLTEQIPKSLIKLNNQTILETKLEAYLRQGFDQFIFCLGYKGDLIRQTLLQSHLKIQAEFSDEGEEAGILERLYQARTLFEDQVLMTYGDTFTDLDLSHFIVKHQSSGNEATIVVAPIQNPFGLVEFDQNDKVTYFKEKPILNYYIGYAIINKSAFDLIPPKIFTMPDGEGLIMFYKILMAMEKLGVDYHSGLQITFNTPEELKSAEEQLVRFYTTSEH